MDSLLKGPFVICAEIFLIGDGDKLSSHQIGDFRECFSSGPICRFCLAKTEHIGEKWHEEDFIIRTREMHAQHINLIKTDSNLSSVYGVNGESCLSSLKSFDVKKGLPPDVMHDLFEGVIPFAMKHIVRHIISSHVLALDQLNERLSSFPLQGCDKKSRMPPPINQCLAHQPLIVFFVFSHYLWGILLQRETMHTMCTSCCLPWLTLFLHLMCAVVQLHNCKYSMIFTLLLGKLFQM